MNIYKNIRYYRTWIRGNWFLVLPDFQTSIQLIDGCTEDDIYYVIENDVYQYI